MRQGRLRRHLRWIEPLVGVGLFALALAALHRELGGHGPREIGRSLRSLPPAHLAMAAGLALFSYLVLTFHDYLAVRYAGHRLPYRTVAPASFVSYALSNNLGMTLLTGVPARFRFYSAAGLAPMEIARIVAFVSATFWLGVAALSGTIFVIEPLAIPTPLRFGLASTRVLGLALLGMTVAYLGAVLLYRKPFQVRSVTLRLPSPRTAVLQILLASADLAAAGGAFYILLPAEATVSFPRFLAIYLLALIAGLVSQVPGGLGVFEAVVITTLPADVPGAMVFATLLAYRAVYYILPLFAAGGVLVVSGARRYRDRLLPVWQGVWTWASAMMPHVAAMVVFLAGTVLLFSGSMPGLHERLRQLGAVVPLPLIELSHLLGSLVGVCLLFVARGLQRRLDSAYAVTLVLLVVGGAASLVKGLDYEEAGLLGLVALLLLPMRTVFYRKGRLLAEPFTIHWFAAMSVALGASFWLGFLAFRHVEYSEELWWQFALHGDAPRFLRAAVAVSVLAVAVSLYQLLRPPLPPLESSGAAASDRAAAIVARSPRPEAHLALLGDKTLLFSAGDDGFLMYAVEGRSWIAMGDPVGPKDVQRELVWSFRGLVDRYDAWPVFYEIRAESAPLYLDLGLTLLKLGEEAVVSLEEFSLEGGARRKLRHARHGVEKQGCSFSVVPAEGSMVLLPELRPVSDQWLTAKNAREKGFSLGFFDEAYLRRCPLAVVRCRGSIVAFANLWPGAGGEELSVDLMRYTADAPGGVMDYLFVELMLWARQEGYRRFSLGMAPMSGLEAHALAPLWSRAGAFLFHHAEDFYNFQGLRAYKEKFDPVWEPRYLASPAGFALPRILANLTTLIGGGVRGLVGK